MQEELEQRTVSVSIQAAKLSGRVLRSAIAAVLRKMEQERTTPKVGRNSMKRLTYKDPGANTIEVSGRIRSFERYARKHQVRYHIEKELGTDPPKWTVYFKANQADALTAAFKEFTRKDLTRSTRPSLLSQLHKFKELAQALGKALGLSPCLLADLAAELLELLPGFCAGGIDRKLARGIRVSQHLLRLALGFGYRDLGLSFRLSNIAYCFK